jgi:hypothetical protein
VADARAQSLGSYATVRRRSRRTSHPFIRFQLSRVWSTNLSNISKACDVDVDAVGCLASSTFWDWWPRHRRSPSVRKHAALRATAPGLIRFGGRVSYAVCTAIRRSNAAGLIWPSV